MGTHRMNAPSDFADAFARCPLVAILRGIEPKDAGAVGEVLVEAGFTLIEVPLNSPDPFHSLELLVRRIGSKAVVGAGTVLRAAEVTAVKSAGGRMVVSPNTDRAVIQATAAAGMASLPGYATVSEAFSAIAAGAHVLKLFPAEASNPSALKAQLAVLPKSAPIAVVGGISEQSFAPWLAAGAAGFGLGSAVYKPKSTAAQVAESARRMVDAFKSVQR